jgi:hypothetical protein
MPAYARGSRRGLTGQCRAGDVALMGTRSR